MSVGPVLCFLENSAQCVAGLLCRFAPRQDAYIIYVSCRHSGRFLAAFVYQIGIVEEVKDRRQRRALS